MIEKAKGSLRMTQIEGLIMTERDGLFRSEAKAWPLHY